MAKGFRTLPIFSVMLVAATTSLGTKSCPLGMVGIPHPSCLPSKDWPSPAAFPLLMAVAELQQCRARHSLCHG